MSATLRAASYLQEDLSDAEVQLLVLDTVVWANQHGLVRVKGCTCSYSCKVIALHLPGGSLERQGIHQP
jgi:hypothetical protein